MFNLVPWKKRNSGGGVTVQHAEPSRQDHPLAHYRDEFDMLWNRFFDRWASRRGMRGLQGPWNDARFDWNWDVGWEDKENEYVFHAELPGFEPDDFDVNVSGNALTVRAEHKDQGREKTGGSYRYDSFRRTLTLPSGVDAKAIHARYHSGVLQVNLPKTKQGRGKRIPVNTN